MRWGSGRRRALAAAFPFVFMFGLVAILARAQALQTSGPWFDPPISEAFYGVTLVSAVLLTAVTGFWAAHRRSVLDDRARGVDVRLAVIRSALSTGEVDVSLSTSRAESKAASAPLDQPALATGTGIFQQTEARFVSLEGTEAVAATKGALEVEAEQLRSIQKTWLAQRDSVWPFVTGPISVSILYAIIAGTLLPGAAGFLVTNFRLNTTLILFIGYTWWLLLSWLVVGLASQGREPKKAKPATETS